MELYVICISREYGSGGRIIGQKLAFALNIPFYDKEIIAMTAEESGLSIDFIKETEERKTGNFFTDIFQSTVTPSIDNKVFLAQSQVIREIAKKESCVIIGRCADYVLRDHPRCLKIFIHSPLKLRTARAEDDYGIIAADVEAYVKKTDRNRLRIHQRWVELLPDYAIDERNSRLNSRADCCGIPQSSGFGQRIDAWWFSRD